MSRCVVLDRDGVINHNSAAYIKTPKECIPIPGSLEAIARLNQAGITVLVATNQSGIARGFFDEPMLTAIHKHLFAQLKAVGGFIHALRYCPHGPWESCTCRKPLPGLLHQLKALGFALHQDTPFVGDAPSDWACAHQFGCLSVGIGQATDPQHKPSLRFPDLAAFVDFWLKKDKPHG